MIADLERPQGNQLLEIVDVTVFYLEMLSPSQRTVPAPRDGLSVLHVHAPTVSDYRDLYNSVGRDFHWLNRRKLTDAELAAIIQNPSNELHVLHVAGMSAGFAELDRRQPVEIELVQFGLLPEFIGHGLGKWFLGDVQRTLDANPFVLDRTTLGEGYTGLHIAVQSKDKKMIEYLIEQGANIQARDSQGKTPLDMARETNQPEVVELLERFRVEG